MSSFFEYRIVKVKSTDGSETFMPQRGFPEGSNAIASPFVWRDAVPTPAPTLELARLYVGSIQSFDAIATPGEVVWKTPTAP